MQLLVLEGPAAYPTFDVTQPTTLIGRAPDCDVLVFDAQVSRHHAQIVRHGADYILEGLQQANPVIINDRILMGRRRLVDRDLIVVGGVVFEVDIPPAPATKTAVAVAGVAQPAVPIVEDRRPPRPPALPPIPPREALRAIAARLAAAGQRIASRAAAQQEDYAVTRADTPDVDAILSEHERLGGDDELARLARLLSERLSNQTDIRALYRLGAEAGALIAWSRLSERSKLEAAHLAQVLGA